MMKLKKPQDRAARGFPIRHRLLAGQSRGHAGRLLHRRCLPHAWARSMRRRKVSAHPNRLPGTRRSPSARGWTSSTTPACTRTAGRAAPAPRIRLQGQAQTRPSRSLRGGLTRTRGHPFFRPGIHRGPRSAGDQLSGRGTRQAGAPDDHRDHPPPVGEGKPRPDARKLADQIIASLRQSPELTAGVLYRIADLHAIVGRPDQSGAVMTRSARPSAPTTTCARSGRVAAGPRQARRSPPLVRAL